MVISDVWNLVWILPVLAMVNRAVFCPRDERRNASSPSWTGWPGSRPRFASGGVSLE